MENKKLQPSNGFFIVKNDIVDVYGQHIGPYGLAIYSILKRHEGQKTKTCFPSINTICRLSGLSKNTVNKYLKLLEGYGLIEKQMTKWKTGGFSSNLYRMLEPQVPIFEFTSNKLQSSYRVCTDTVPTVSGYHSNEPPLVNSEPSTVNSQHPAGQGVGTNKTQSEQELNINTNLPLTNDCYKSEEYLTSYYQRLKDVFPALDGMQLAFIWNEALKKKGGDPKPTKDLMEQIIKNASKQKRHIKNYYPWLISAVRNNNWYVFKDLKKRKR